MFKESNMQLISPASIPQELFLNSDDVDICFYGGSAGGGKSFASLMHHLKWANDPNYRGLTLRRTTPMLLKPGAIWDEAKTLYRQADPKCQIKIKDLKFVMNSGAEIAFSHFEQADATDNFQGSQLSSVVFDELTHFEESQFLYLLSRLRTKANMKPVARATMNPDPNSWVRKWVDWYLFPKGHELFGRPDPEKQGKIRWFVRDNNEMVWANTKEELLKLYPKATPLSFRMIFATAYDNPYIEPTYIAFLEGLPRIEREILLHGNWEARAESSGYWKREWVEVIDLPPTRTVQRVRAWDISGTLPSDTNPNPDWTAGTLMSKDKNSIYYIEDVVRDRRRYGGVFELILETARRDGSDTKIIIPRDPGAAGQAYAADIIRQLAEYGFAAKSRPTNKSKVQRFAPFAALCEAGGVRLVRGDWNEPFMMELERFDGSRNVKDDQVDSSADAFTELAANIHIPDFLPEDFSTTNPFKM